MTATTVQTASIAQAIQERRSIRKLTNSPALSQQRVKELVKLALHSPTAFNMQSGRLLVLMNEGHQEFWDLVKETLRQIVPAENFPATEERLNGFRAGLGTVLFFEDQNTIKNYQEQFSSYAQAFPAYSQQGSGMLQYAMWLVLSSEGLGVSLQHYNPLIDEQVKSKWGIPEGWSLVAQMPFGWPAEQAGQRSFLPFEDVVKWG
ncbi:nitroreductase family protein [Paenibacillus albiflavus]|uniref:Nitroreductase family protein n=1 Tax=Paenibacillus albiflavus TaxID=2545760 RepID=A0A4R4EBM2_9BACL|nr:nitroreductase family protein [Paenibacillus albiflavus]TCZ76340.1 nitroreductase family protein [Paenibacillus albiflavus]